LHKIRLRTDLLTPSNSDRDVERVIEERLQRAKEQIAAMEEYSGGNGGGKPS
jgi:guanylate kinase